MPRQENKSQSRVVEKSRESFPNGVSLLTETVATTNDIPVILGNGVPTTLRFTEYSLKKTTGVWYSRRKKELLLKRPVEATFQELPDDTQRAIIYAANLAQAEALTTPPHPQYTRLALHQNADQTTSLYTVKFAPDQNRSISMYPATEDLDLNLPVLKAHIVSSSYLIVPVSYDAPLTYRDGIPNFFGPGKEDANAFWISGQFRQITVDQKKYSRYSLFELNQRLLRFENQKSFPRFAIAPVDYFRVATSPWEI